MFILVRSFWKMTCHNKIKEIGQRNWLGHYSDNQLLQDYRSDRWLFIFMYVCNTQPWFQQHLSRISLLCAQHGSECDQCCFHVCVKVLSCFVFIIHVLPFYICHVRFVMIWVLSPLSCLCFVLKLISPVPRSGINSFLISLFIYALVCVCHVTNSHLF